MKKAFLLGLCSFLLCSTSYTNNSTELVNESLNKNTNTVTRTVNYENKLFDEETLIENFDSYDFKKEDNGDIYLSASKEFDMSLLEGIDFVGLNQDQDKFTTIYEVMFDESINTIILTAKIVGDNDIYIVDNIPGLFCYNSKCEPDVLFIIDDQQLWLSDFGDDDSLIDQTGWFKNVFKAVANAVTNLVINVANEIRNVVKVVLQCIVKICCNVAYKLIGRQNCAAIGAWILQMEEEQQRKQYSDGSVKIEKTGIYHAIFDCWQQVFGYNDLYDIIFDSGTSMRFDKFAFTHCEQDYIIWCWKGDYLNLGAGCELGIYKKWDYCDNIWVVDKGLACPMTLKLEYFGEQIIDYSPLAKQWWITGFNSNYDDACRDNLKATFTIKFDCASYIPYFSQNLYHSFWDEWNGKAGITGNYWSFNGNYEAKFSF